MDFQKVRCTALFLVQVHLRTQLKIIMQEIAHERRIMLTIKT
jgi:hypothetical protein